MTELSYGTVETPIGLLTIVADDTHLKVVHFAKDDITPPPGCNTNAVVERTASQLTEYFARNRQQFDVPLAPEGTEFQRRVWDGLCDIPHGETISYGELAERIGKPAASRAVGAANGKNPIPIIIPCHRVIGSNGKLTGFGGGLPIKEALLQLESPLLR